ncbi:uncharacterized protein TRAVEDRAFT_53974 [Trametes versicolor FP-101664 SS1]|uniref:Uncharacterized protein n=1 Tax=Trametes versicolor (strain FP-101664) TaxID=717944 RepID=R7S8H6_TRAVS|nr:uncharacterized protein TRAVEDRAFT_53974 [Trametes versicolor FP-101664 SS1]EIW51990.1 hypothetical protein TRAVEDRAFT_53974 [Trametes versicolor FP-101664 SS1]
MPELNLIRQYRLVRIRGRSHYVANPRGRDIYSPELRQLCELDSLDRMPEAPHFCPKRNCQARTTFTAQLCYAEGWAGAWGYVCDLCHGIHWPWQPGPTEYVLRLIEECRHFDREEEARRKLERQAEADKRRRQREDDEARRQAKRAMREVKKRQRAVEKATRQAAQAQKAAERAQRKVADAAKVALKRRAVAERRQQVSDALRMEKGQVMLAENINNTRSTAPTINARAVANDANAASRLNMRILDVVVWATNNAVPTRTEVRVDANKPLCLGLFGHLLPDHDPQDPYPFEYWETGLQNWLPVIDDLMDLALSRDATVLLVRVDTVTRCEQFGLELHCQQQQGALDINSVSDLVEAAGRYRHQVMARGVTIHGVWIVFWRDDDLLPSSRLVPLDANASIRLDDHSDIAATMAAQARPRFEVWSHEKTEWRTCDVDAPFEVPAGTHTMLVRIANLEDMPRLGLEIDMLDAPRDIPQRGAPNPALGVHGIENGFEAWSRLYEGYEY